MQHLIGYIYVAFFSSLFTGVAVAWLLLIKLDSARVDAREWKREHDYMSGRYQTLFSEYWQLRTRLSDNPEFKLPPMMTTYAYIPPPDTANMATGEESK